MSHENINYKGTPLIVTHISPHTDNHGISPIVIHLLATSAYTEKWQKTTMKMRMANRIDNTLLSIRFATRCFPQSNFYGGRFSFTSFSFVLVLLFVIIIISNDLMLRTFAFFSQNFFVCAHKNMFVKCVDCMTFRCCFHSK